MLSLNASILEGRKYVFVMFAIKDMKIIDHLEGCLGLKCFCLLEMYLPLVLLYLKGEADAVGGKSGT